MPTGESDRLPNKCLVMDDNGNLPTCTQTGDGGWEVSYPSAAGPGGGFGVLFVLALVLGLALTAWKVSAARRMARNAGMDPGDATTMTLLTDDGFEATYLASNLRGPREPAGPTASAATASDGADAAERLRRLEELRVRGLISDEEYDAKRQGILDSL